MNFEEELEKWDRFFTTTRQVGHTYSALNGVLNNDKALLVCAHEMQRKLFPKNKTINFAANLQGSRFPVVFDNFTVHRLIMDSLRTRISRQEARKIIDEELQVTKEIIDKELQATRQRIRVRLGI